jgi:hypothetical protein
LLNSSLLGMNLGVANGFIAPILSGPWTMA